jgi:hypothetical protein
MSRRVACRIVFMLQVASVGIVLAGPSERPAAAAEDVLPLPLSSLTRSDATGGGQITSLPAEEDEEPTAACWVASAGSCLCSAGTIEDLMTPDFMRVLLTIWRDSGHLTTIQWQERLREIDAACESWSAGP